MSESKGLFNCFHAGCNFRGNAFMLAKELGLIKPLPRAEYEQEQQERRWVRKLAAAVAEQVSERRKALAHAERVLSRAAVAHAAGPVDGSWAVLAIVYAALPRVRAEFAFMNDAPALGVLEFLATSPKMREEVLDRIVVRGGVEDEAGQFCELPARKLSEVAPYLRASVQTCTVFATWSKPCCQG